MMDKLRLETLAVRVVEWHNRHPLARRIGVQHVQSIGYVALPFRAGDAAPATAGELPAGASLRERAMARAGQPSAAQPPAAAPDRPPEAAFDEAFLGPISPSQVARWAVQHAREIAVDPADGPVRRVAATGADSTRSFYALTALVEIAGRRSRVLVGAGERPSVLGRRLWSLPRLAAVAGALAAAAGLAWIWLHVPPQGVSPAASPAASAASAASAVAKPASAPVAVVATPQPAPAPPLAASMPATMPPASSALM